MRILVLDDDKGRLSLFKQKLIGHVVDCVETAPEAIMRLSEGALWDIVFLDHDLADTQMVASGPGTGWEVAKWLSEHLDRKPAQIVIHSFNEPGAKNMLSLLPGAIYVPGIWAMERIFN
jgi:CheY-like chemotaxis protein